jgi:LAO/AO transport system kinase
MTGSKPPARSEISLDEYLEGLRQGDRATLGRAITLVESHRREHQLRAQQLLQRLLPDTGQAIRVGITGVPGVGKSTFIERLGCNLTAAGHRVAVLAIDPSSALTGGSILGDKTRMVELSRDPAAFIRPSPSGGSLGGVARKTRETMLVCEAAGFDVVLVETVGVGQSEAVVAGMVDFFLLLMLAGAGDQLQGIKRGVIELADMIAINKADGDNAARAERARRDYEAALGFLRPRHGGWTPPVVTCSALQDRGLAELWQRVLEHRRLLGDSGELQRQRVEQQLQWMWSIIEDELQEALRAHPGVQSQLPRLERAVREGRTTPAAAARALLDAFGLSSGR